MASTQVSGKAQVSPDIAVHLRNALDGRWQQVRNRSREQLSNEIFRPHYTPNTAIARAKALEQLKIIAAAGAAEDGFRKEHGGTGDVGSAVITIEMLAMSDLSLMVKAGVQWGLFGGAIENLGTVLHASNMDFSDLVKLTIYTTDVDDFLGASGASAEALGSNLPAMTLIGVARLAFPELKVEIEAIAAK